MKRYLPFALILAAGLLAIIVAQRQRIATRPSPQAILSVTADAEQQLTRIPLNLDRLSDADEIRIGDALAHSYESSLSSTNQAQSTQQIAAYVQQVGTTVAAHARRKLPYRFHYIPRDTLVNAFALPGGHVFVGAGLYKLLRSEDALAAVLGHEVEHIDLRHCADRIQTEAHLRDLGTLGDLASLPVGLFMAGYSKQQELDADHYGTALAVAAAYSPAGILQLFDEFEKLEHSTETNPQSPVDEAARLPIQTLQDYFRSHPPAAERRQQILTLIRSEHWRQLPLRPLKFIASAPAPPPNSSS